MLNKIRATSHRNRQPAARLTTLAAAFLEIAFAAIVLTSLIAVLCFGQWVVYLWGE
jgi:hypothetical protein